jgi:hypothetical protein
MWGKKKHFKKIVENQKKKEIWKKLQESKKKIQETKKNRGKIKKKCIKKGGKTK